MAGKVWRAQSAATAPVVVQALGALKYVHERNDGLTAHLRRGDEHLSATGEPNGTALAFDGPLGVPPPDVMAALSALPGFSVAAAVTPATPDATVVRDSLPAPPTGAAAAVVSATAPAPPPPTSTTSTGVSTFGAPPPPSEPGANAGVGDADGLEPAAPPDERPPYLRIAGIASIVVGSTLVIGTVAAMAQTKDLGGIDGWPFIALGVLFLVGGYDATRGSRVGLAASGAAAGGFALIMFFALRIFSALSQLLQALGSGASLGASLLPWTIAAVLAGAVFVGGLASALASDHDDRADGIGALLVLLGAAAAVAGMFLVATGKPSARGIITGEVTSTVVGVGLLAILVVGALLAAGQRTPASFAFAAGAGFVWLVVSAANAEAVIGGRSLGSVDRADLALTLGGAALVTLVGAVEAWKTTSSAGSGTGVVAVLGAVAGLVLIIPVLSTAKGQSLTATGSGLDGLSTLRSSSPSSGSSAGGSSSSGSSSSGSSSSRRTTTTQQSSTTLGTTTTTRPTTTTTIRRTTTTTTRRDVTGTVRAEGCGSTCRIFRRFTPFDDLSKKGGSYRIDGDRVTVRCVTTGQFVHDGDTGRESSLWYQIDSDWWMSAVYLSVSDPSSVAQC